RHFALMFLSRCEWFLGLTSCLVNETLFCLLILEYLIGDLRLFLQIEFFVTITGDLGCFVPLGFPILFPYIFFIIPKILGKKNFKLSKSGKYEILSNLFQIYSSKV